MLERDIRQRRLVPHDRLANSRAVIVGVGAIGRQVAVQLAAMGMPRLTLIDHDTVRVENLAPQGYWPEDLGRHKVQATEDLCRRINPEMEIVTVADRWRRSAATSWRMAEDTAIFACVDSIETRRTIWKCVRQFVGLFVDGRMNAEIIRVLAVDHLTSNDTYERSLFAADEAFVGACTARSTVYTASIAAGLISHQFVRWLRGQPLEADQTLNLLAAELST